MQQSDCRGQPRYAADGVSRRAFLERGTLALGALVGGAVGCGATAEGRGSARATSPSSDATMTITLGVIGLVVRDLERSLTFYRRLGLDIPAGADRITLPNGLTFFWDTADFVRRLDPGWRPPAGGRRVVLEFACGSARELDAKYAELTGFGYAGHLPPFDTGFGPRYAIVRDPDENEISLRFAPG